MQFQQHHHVEGVEIMTKIRNEKIRPVILCGGQGTRLWPVSRASFPKQFARIFSEKSLFQETLSLVSDQSIFEPPIIVGAESFEHILRSHLREINITNAKMILEPEGRNTAAAITLACLSIQKNECFLVLPSDHLISDKEQFLRDVEELAQDARRGYIGLFGIKPEHASSDYGYIEVDRNRTNTGTSNKAVNCFKEKPNQQVAETYVASGHHYWNSGIFLFNRHSMIGELNAHASSILSLCKKALKDGRKIGRKFYPNADVYAAVPSMPIDIAVMEITNKAVMKKANFDWLDIGSWKSYATTCEQDDNGNSATGPVYLEDCRGNLIHAGEKLVTAIGLENYTVIDTDDALLIMPTDRAGQLSSVVKKMRKAGISQSSEHQKVRRPWGSYKGIHHGSEHQVKHIIVKPNEKLSYQYHYYRSEHWIVVKGKGVVTIADKEMPVQENDSVYIPAGTAHRLHNPFAEELHLIEVQYGTYLGEDDIVRLDDVYGRIENKMAKINNDAKV